MIIRILQPSRADISLPVALTPAWPSLRYTADGSAGSCGIVWLHDGTRYLYEASWNTPTDPTILAKYWIESVHCGGHMGMGQNWAPQ